MINGVIIRSFVHSQIRLPSANGNIFSVSVSISQHRLVSDALQIILSQTSDTHRTSSTDARASCVIRTLLYSWFFFVNILIILDILCSSLWAASIDGRSSPLAACHCSDY